MQILIYQQTAEYQPMYQLGSNHLEFKSKNHRMIFGFYLVTQHVWLHFICCLNPFALFGTSLIKSFKMQGNKLLHL